MSYARFPLQLLTVGRPIGKNRGDTAFLDEGVRLYEKRLKPYVALSFAHVADEPVHKGASRDQVLQAEGLRIVKAVQQAGFVVALSEHGKLYDSQAFSAALFDRNPYTNPSNGCTVPVGAGPMIVVIGGALGLADQVLHRADWVVSLSLMTFPHAWVPLIFLEQLYRACRIHYREPYHK